MLVYAVADDSLSKTFPLGDALEDYVRAARTRSSRRSEGDDPELAKPLRIEERELEAGGRN